MDGPTGQQLFCLECPWRHCFTTQRIRVGTGVTCPIQRIHPAIIAQAAATVAAMMPGRFFLGHGTGENLNGHILGDKWQPIEIRRDMLEEALQILRLLWRRGEQSHLGRYFRVENARLYTLPRQAPEIFVAAAGAESAELAGRIADGLICTSPKNQFREKFDAGGSTRRPHIGQIAVCWAKTEQQARKTAFEWWAVAALKGELTQELSRPGYSSKLAQPSPSKTWQKQSYAVRTPKSIWPRSRSMSTQGLSKCMCTRSDRIRKAFPSSIKWKSC